MVKKYKRITCNRFKKEAGRTIICADTGKEVFHIAKEEGFSPTEADAMTDYIVKMLNENKDFRKFYKKYMDA
jgi:hypothetical protein